MNLSQRASKKLSDLFHTHISPVLAGSKGRRVECPFCGWQGPEFLPNGLPVAAEFALPEM